MATRLDFSITMYLDNRQYKYVGISEFPGEGTPFCGSDFPLIAQPFTINRQFCQGTWSIAPTSIRLLAGSCNDTLLPPKKQVVIADNVVAMGTGCMNTLAEILRRFSTSNESRWIDSYMATSMAAIPWSRITAKTNITNLNDAISSIGDGNITYEDVGPLYPVNDTVVYIRPTLRKSGLLYCVFAIQPLLIIIILGLIVVFHSTPLDKGFGLISILSGVHRGSLDILAGAALSGELKQKIKLIIEPVHDEQKGTIEYHMVPPSACAVRNRKLVSFIDSATNGYHALISYVLPMTELGENERCGRFWNTAFNVGSILRDTDPMLHNKSSSAT